MADLRPADDGSLHIPFAVVEQPLSLRFRRRFADEALLGRVAILVHLVRYAAEPRASLVAITVADAGRQLARRDEELWQRVTGARGEESNR